VPSGSDLPPADDEAEHTPAQPPLAEQHDAADESPPQQDYPPPFFSGRTQAPPVGGLRSYKAAKAAGTLPDPAASGALPRPAPATMPSALEPEPAPTAPEAVFVRAPAEPALSWPRSALDAPPVRLPPLPASAVPVPVPSPRRVPAAPRHYLRRTARGIAGLLLALAGLILALIVLYRWINPPLSTLMLGQWLAGEPIDQRWVPLERISPNLRLATIMSEDGRFCYHRGVDWSELEEAIESARDGTPRGGSTISMQVVKNLFLWPSKSYIRKAIEIPLTYVAEAAWSKRRILEIYLNIAEWGPGVFGAEAAARYHFRKPASQLGLREAALLAVALPNPFEREAGHPGPGTSRLADNLLARMRTAQANAFCVRPGQSASRSRVSGNAR
jgi:monofunctional biosynthetic peptidoglycan transglycosylase